jgi:hypothetical protein
VFAQPVPGVLSATRCREPTGQVTPRPAGDTGALEAGGERYVGRFCPIAQNAAGDHEAALAGGCGDGQIEGEEDFQHSNSPPMIPTTSSDHR